MKMRVLKDYASSLFALNSVADEKMTEAPTKASVSRNISALYDALTLEPGETGSWNWGMYDESVDSEIRTTLVDYDQYGSDGFSEQLYFFAAKDTILSTTGKRNILEIGCGIGVGLNFLSRLNASAHFTGLDLSPAAIERAKASYARNDSVKFVQGDAEALPFPDESFDVVLNVESSHNYPNLTSFYCEAARILKKGGYLTQVDFYTAARYELLQRVRAETGQLDWQRDEEISERVKAAILRRMRPGSTFRTKSRGTRSFPIGALVERSSMVGYGADFAEYRLGSWFTVFRTLVGDKTFPASSYRFLVARKV
jgi:ubiquinone/menaquinone biosynthesis C-methylase UbiE